MDIRYNLRGIDFEWDNVKALTNFSKHKVSFETACEIFADPFLFGGDAEGLDIESHGFPNLVGSCKRHGNVTCEKCHLSSAR